MSLLIDTEDHRKTCLFLEHAELVFVSVAIHRYYVCLRVMGKYATNQNQCGYLYCYKSTFKMRNHSTSVSYVLWLLTGVTTTTI